MPAIARSMTYDIPCRLSAIEAMAAEVDRFVMPLGLPQPTIFAIQLCLEEAVSNVIRHGGLAESESVELSLTHAADGAVTIELCDTGRAFDPVSAPLPAPYARLETAVIGGRGLTLMRRFCPEMQYLRAAGTNCLRLRFPPVGPPA